MEPIPVLDDVGAEKIEGLEGDIWRDFRIRAVTVGPDSQAEATIEAESEGRTLRGRSVSTDSIAQWRLGYAPDGDALTQYLLSVGYSEKELVEVGLALVKVAALAVGLYRHLAD